MQVGVRSLHHLATQKELRSKINLRSLEKKKDKEEAQLAISPSSGRHPEMLGLVLSSRIPW